jgi:hypothetical protein
MISRIVFPSVSFNIEGLCSHIEGRGLFILQIVPLNLFQSILYISKGFLFTLKRYSLHWLTEALAEFESGNNQIPTLNCNSLHHALFNVVFICKESFTEYCTQFLTNFSFVFRREMMRLASLGKLKISSPMTSTDTTNYSHEANYCMKTTTPIPAPWTFHKCFSWFRLEGKFASVFHVECKTK